MALAAERVGVGELRRDVEGVLERVRHGVEVEVEEDGRVLAVISPVRRRRQGKRVTEADIAATKATAGSMRELIDAEALKAQVREGRSDDRPPVQL